MYYIISQAQSNALRSVNSPQHQFVGTWHEDAENNIFGVRVEQSFLDASEDHRVLFNSFKDVVAYPLPLQELDRVFEQAEAQGMSITHNSETYHLQCRPIDRTNWLGVKEIASALQPTDSFTIMSRENVPLQTTASQVLTWVTQVGSYSQALYAARWAVRNDINAGNIPSDIQAAFDQALQTILS